jgi:hypothetical protein
MLVFNLLMTAMVVLLLIIFMMIMLKLASLLLSLPLFLSSLVIVIVRDRSPGGFSMMAPAWPASKEMERPSGLPNRAKRAEDRFSASSANVPDERWRRILHSKPATEHKGFRQEIGITRRYHPVAIY